MAFILETGGGTPNANSYVTPAFVTTYLTDRNRETENSWDSAATARQQEACVVATAYLDNRFGGSLKGIKRRYRITGRTASGTVTFGSVPGTNETVTIGQVTYRFVGTLVQENDVLKGSTVTEAGENLAAAVNGTDDGTKVHEDTRPNLEVTATEATGVVTLTAPVAGENGNEVALSTDVTGATVSGVTLTGGISTAPQPLEFPRTALYDRDGTAITGVPLEVRQATAEYAVRSLAATLDPDPTVDGTSVPVQREYKKVGPLEKSTEYVEGAPLRIHKPYPGADRLLAKFLKPAGTVR